MFLFFHALKDLPAYDTYGVDEDYTDEIFYEEDEK